MVYVRRIEDREFTFIVSGRLWRESLIMQDRETGSFWSHVTGEALLGSMKGRELSTLPVVQTSWAAWKKAHPETKVLVKSRQVRSSSYERYFRDNNRMGLGFMRGRWLQGRMPGKSLVHGVTVGPHAMAVVDADLQPGVPVTATVGDQRVVMVRGSDDGVRAFVAELEGALLDFEATTDSGPYRDGSTGSLWDLEQGIAVGGPLQGERLPPLQVTTSFWFAWSSFYPNTGVIEPN